MEPYLIPQYASIPAVQLSAWRSSLTGTKASLASRFRPSQPQTKTPSPTFNHTSLDPSFPPKAAMNHALGNEACETVQSADSSGGLFRLRFPRWPLHRKSGSMTFGSLNSASAVDASNLSRPIILFRPHDNVARSLSSSTVVPDDQAPESFRSSLAIQHRFGLAKSAALTSA
ncbi:unnamed protein product, partial [Protopolystoma xenopodis]